MHIQHLSIFSVNRLQKEDLPTFSAVTANSEDLSTGLLEMESILCQANFLENSTMLKNDAIRDCRELVKIEISSKEKRARKAKSSKKTVITKWRDFWKLKGVV